MERMARTTRQWAILLCTLALLASCSKHASESAGTPKFVAAPAKPKVAEYTFGVTPMSNFRNIYDVFRPIVDHLNANLTDARLVLEVPRGLAEHEQALQARSFAFALSNPYHSWRAAQQGGYRIFAKMGDDSAFRGIWVVRKDSGIKTLADLKGKPLCFPPKSALAATMMTQLQLKENGIDPVRDIQASYVGSQHASIMAVYQKSALAGATWPLAWITFQRMHPDEARQLEVRFPTGSLVNQGIVARNDVPPEVVRHVGELMVAMSTTERGRALLAQVPISSFELAGDAQYDVVRTFMEQYQRTFPVAPD
ncbi:MAG: phosphate/phosphite/phosphonate ABC transporter substrate-binding protein [Pseudomonadota bacterium]